MIHLNLAIDNPWSDRFAVLASTSKMIAQHTAVEANVYRASVIAILKLDYTIQQDHAGLRVVLGLFGYECEFHVYDTRHWDDKNNRWASVNS
jgi:hypothetical protein